MGERHETSLMEYDAAYGWEAWDFSTGVWGCMWVRGMTLLYWGSDCIWGKRCEISLLGYETAYGWEAWDFSTGIWGCIWVRSMRLLYWGMRLHMGKRHETSLLGYEAAYGVRYMSLLDGFTMGNNAGSIWNLCCLCLVVHHIYI